VNKGPEEGGRQSRLEISHERKVAEAQGGKYHRILMKGKKERISLKKRLGDEGFPASFNSGKKIFLTEFQKVQENVQSKRGKKGETCRIFTIQ